MVRKALLLAAMAGFISATANAAEIPYSANIGTSVQLSGAVEMDDSSGDADSASGIVAGAVSGKFALDAVGRQAELDGAGFKLIVNFSPAAQRLSAHLDSCPANVCQAGATVILWEK